MVIISVQSVVIDKYAERSHTPYKEKYLEIITQQVFTSYDSLLKKLRHIVPVVFTRTCQRIMKEKYIEHADPSQYFRNGLYYDFETDIYYLIHVILDYQEN